MKALHKYEMARARSNGASPPGPPQPQPDGGGAANGVHFSDSDGPKPQNVNGAAPEKPFGCDRCDSRFTSKKLLGQHKARVHNKKKYGKKPTSLIPLPEPKSARPATQVRYCCYCGYDLLDILGVLGQRETFRCSECQKGFNSPLAAVAHGWRAHQKEVLVLRGLAAEGPWELNYCPQCGHNIVPHFVADATHQMEVQHADR
jgi:hypothetical protein